MKKTIFPILLALAAAVMSSCSSDNEPARTPVASVSVEKTQLAINESMEIQFTGVADQVVVFTGDEGHVYQQYGAGDTKANTGLVVNKGLFTYSYKVPGTFHVVVVATTYDTYSGDGRQQAKHEFDVVVTDDCTTLDKLYSSITPNVYYASMVNDRDWVICLPSKQVYKGREIELKANRQRLAYYIQSDSSKVFINGAEYSARAYYDLTAVNAIHVVAHSGATRDYRLYSAIYPEFTAVSVGDAPCSLVRNAFDQDMLTYNCSGAGGRTIAFTVGENVQFCVDGTAAESPVEYSEGSAYTLVYTSPDNPDVKAVSRIRFAIE